MRQIITTSTLGILMIMLTNLNAQDTTTYFVPEDVSTIQAAMNIANRGDSIFVGPGTYYENLVWPDGKDLFIKSLSGNTETIIDGGRNDRVVVINSLSNESTFDGFTIQNGFTDDEQGAGIMARSSNITFENLIIRDNFITGVNGEGAGLYLIDYSGRIASCQFKNNIIDVTGRASGGGLYLRLDDNIIIESCSFANNESKGTTHAEAGGLFIYWHGINFTGSQTPIVRISNSSISENVVSGEFEYGGGLSIYGFGPHFYVYTDSTIISNNKSLGDRSFGGGVKLYSTVNLTMTDCTVENNYAADGAGFYQSSVTDESISYLDRCKIINNFSTNSNNIDGAIEVYKRGSCTLSNCEVSNNNAFAIISENLSGISHVSLINCTLAKNKASLHIRKTNLDIWNSIIWNDDNISVSQHSFDEDNNINISYSILKDDSNSNFDGEYNLGSDPLFVSENDLRPAPQSPCINNGDSSINNTIDILGNARPLPVGSNSDIGAYEVDQTTSTADASKELGEIIVFPNPSLGQINFSEEINSLSIYSLAGELLLQRKNIDHIVTHGFTNGVYILKIDQGKKSKQEKVIFMN